MKPGDWQGYASCTPEEAMKRFAEKYKVAIEDLEVKVNRGAILVRVKEKDDSSN